MVISEQASNRVNKSESIVTIGTFDGVHLGHQKILHDIVKRSISTGLKSVVLTLFPHPRMVLQKDESIKLLNTIDERISILKSIGVDHVEVKTFTKEFANLSAEDYVKQILVNDLNAKSVVIGYDHQFGKNRSGNINDLIRFGDSYGFDVREIKAQQIDEVSISSTKIRNALFKGDVALANIYLGYAYSITGTVVEGDKIGRTLGYRTANIQVNEDYKLIPNEGVYVVKSNINNKEVFGMMNIGRNPTIPDKKPSTEVHFFDFDGDLYGSTLTIEFIYRLRDEFKFDSIDALRSQLEQDKLNSLNYLSQLK